MATGAVPRRGRDRRGALGGLGLELGRSCCVGEIDADGLDGSLEDRLHRAGQRPGGTGTKDGETGHGGRQRQAWAPALEPVDQRVAGAGFAGGRGDGREALIRGGPAGQSPGQDGGQPSTCLGRRTKGIGRSQVVNKGTELVIDGQSGHQVQLVGAGVRAHHGA